MLDVCLSATPHSYAQIVFSNAELIWNELDDDDDEASDERLDAICAEMVKAIQNKDIPGLGEMECVGKELRFVPNAGVQPYNSIIQQQSCKERAALLQQAVHGRSVFDGSMRTSLAYAAWGDLASRLPSPVQGKLGYYKTCTQYCGDTPVNNFLGVQDDSFNFYNRQRCNSFAKIFNIYFGLDNPMARPISCGELGALEISRSTLSHIDAHVDCMAVAMKMNWILSNEEFYSEFKGFQGGKHPFNCTSMDPYARSGSALTLSKVVSSSSTPEISEPDFQNYYPYLNRLQQKILMREHIWDSDKFMDDDDNTAFTFALRDAEVLHHYSQQQGAQIDTLVSKVSDLAGRGGAKAPTSSFECLYTPSDFQNYYPYASIPPGNTTYALQDTSKCWAKEIAAFSNISTAVYGRDFPRYVDEREPDDSGALLLRCNTVPRDLNSGQSMRYTFRSERDYRCRGDDDDISTYPCRLAPCCADTNKFGSVSK